MADPHIIRRHGTDRMNQFRRLLPDRVFNAIVEARKANAHAFSQTSQLQWRGGFFGSRGREDEQDKLADVEKAERKEYLPGPTSLFAATIAGAVAGHLLATRAGTAHLRVTVHRVITIHGEDLLQQACNYVGTGPHDSQSTSGRVFPAGNATIGLAYRTQRIVRSRTAVTQGDLDSAMQRLRLNDASREMARDVRFVAAIPILQPANHFYAPSPVCAVVYFDSRDQGFDLDETAFAELASVISRAMEAVQGACRTTLDRLENTPLRAIESTPVPARAFPTDVADQLAPISAPPPSVAQAFALNIDHSDVTPVAQ